MIDWWMVIAHAVWIGGAAMVVASWSLTRRIGSFWDACGATIFCLGWAVTSSWWAAIIWLAMPFLLLRGPARRHPGHQRGEAISLE